MNFANQKYPFFQNCMREGNQVSGRDLAQSLRSACGLGEPRDQLLVVESDRTDHVMFKRVV